MENYYLIYIIGHAFRVGHVTFIKSSLKNYFLRNLNMQNYYLIYIIGRTFCVKNTTTARNAS